MANSEDKNHWSKPSRKQQLDNRPILSIQELADKLRADLNQLTIFERKTKSKGDWPLLKRWLDSIVTFFRPARRTISDTSSTEGWVSSVVFVNEHSQDNAESLFSYALLGSYNFEHEEMQPVWQWLQDNVDRRRHDVRGRIELLFLATNECDWEQQFTKFRTLVKGVKPYDQNKAHDMEAAHDLLIDALVKVKYRGTVTQAMDDLRKSRDGIGCLWLQYKPADEKSSGGSIGDLIFDEARNFEVSKEKFYHLKTSVAPFSIQKPTTVLSDSESADLQELFRRFVDPFMLGSKLFGTTDDDYPYRISQENDGKVPGFRAYAIPVYEFYGVSNSEWKPTGSLMGWLFLMMDKDFSPPAPGHAARSYLGVRFGVRNFARDVCEYQTLSLLEQEWKRDQKPRDFTLEHFLECSGWMKPNDNEPVSLPDGVRSDIKKRLDDGDYFVFLAKPKSEVVVDDGTPASASSIQYIAIQISDLDSRTESIEPLVFKRQHNTILSEDSERRKAYGLEIAKRARHIYRGAQLRHAERAAAEATVAVIAQEKSAHMIRKLNDRIRSTTSSGDLDAIRHFYCTAFLSPRQIDDTQRFANEFSASFGDTFLLGNTLGELVESAFEYARDLYPKILKAKNAAPKAQPISRSLDFEKSDVWNKNIWNHQELLHMAEENGNSVVSKADTHRLVAKITFYCALISAFLNSLEHSPPESALKAALFENERAIEITNSASEPGASGSGLKRRSPGTKHTLAYYVNIYCTDQDGRLDDELARLLFFPEQEIASTRGGIFKTALPIPSSELIYA